MAYKDKDKQKEYQRKWAAKKFAERKPNTSHIRQRNANYINNIKETTPCADCKNFYPFYVMQFDHLGVEVKFKNVSRMAADNYSLLKIQTEISKCEVVCANCHATRTFLRMGRIAV